MGDLLLNFDATTSLTQGGFVDIAWHPPLCHPEGVELFGEEFWQPYLSNPHAAVMSARAA